MDNRTIATAILIVVAALVLLGWLKTAADAYGKDKDKDGKK